MASEKGRRRKGAYEGPGRGLTFWEGVQLRVYGTLALLFFGMMMCAIGRQIVKGIIGLFN